MVTEFRIKMLEGDMNRRWDDHDKEHVKLDDRVESIEEKMSSIANIVDLVHDIRNYAELTYRVFEPIARFMKVIAKWGTLVGLGWAACTWGVSWLITHIAAPVVKLLGGWRP
jgi:hypothetical protein